MKKIYQTYDNFSVIKKKLNRLMCIYQVFFMQLAQMQNLQSANYCLKSCPLVGRLWDMHTLHLCDSKPWTFFCCKMLDIILHVKYSLKQKLFICNAYQYIRKMSFKTCLEFRRYFPGISVLSKNTIQELAKKVREMSSVVNKKIKSLG